MTTKHLVSLLAVVFALGCSDDPKPPPTTGGDAAVDTTDPPTPDASEPDTADPMDSSVTQDTTTIKDGSFIGQDGAFTSCPTNRDDIPGNRQACEYPKFCWEFRDHSFTKTGDCLNCRNITSDGKAGIYHLGNCGRTDTVGGCSEQTSGGPTVTFYYPESGCGEGGTCTSADVQAACKAPKTYVPPGA